MAFFDAIFEDDWPTPSSYHEKAENQSTNSRSCITTNISNVNGSTLATSNTEKGNHENSQEDCGIALQSDDTLDKNESEPIAITHATYTNSSTISKITTIEHERNPLSDNEIRVRGPSDESQGEQRFTTNENPINDCKINSVSLLNPLFTLLSNQADRDRELKDYFGNKPVLIVNGSLSDSIEIEMAMISTSSQCEYNSVYCFHDLDHNTFTNKLRRKVKVAKIGDFYLIELDQLFVRKDQNYTRKIGDKNSKLFKLTRYPSGEEIHVRAKGPTIFAKKYNLMQVRLAIQFFSGNSTTPININDAKKEFIFFSNIIGKGPNVEKLSATDIAKVTITDMTPDGNLISFNDDNEFAAEFQIKFTDNFADKLKSYSKCFEISLFNDKFNSIYYIKTNEGLKNVTYMKITCTRFTIPLTIAKQTLPELEQNPDILGAIHSSSHTVAYHEGSFNINPVIVSMGLNKFYIQFRLLPGVITSAGEQPLCYPDAPICQPIEYIEHLEQSTDTIMQETVDGSEQNPTDINLNSK